MASHHAGESDTEDLVHHSGDSEASLGSPMVQHSKPQEPTGRRMPQHVYGMRLA